MPDNVSTNGTTIRTVDLNSAGVHYQVWIPSSSTGALIGGSAATGLMVDVRSRLSTPPTMAIVDMSDGLVHTLFSANANVARERTIANRSTTKWLLVKCGISASLTSYGIPIPPLTFYRFDFIYDGIVTGILEASDVGAKAVTQEFI